MQNLNNNELVGYFNVGFVILLSYLRNYLVIFNQPDETILA